MGSQIACRKTVVAHAYQLVATLSFYRNKLKIAVLTWCAATWSLFVSTESERIVREPEMSLKAMAQEKIERAGIANYSFDEDKLILCGVRYAINACSCGETDCDGVQLQRVADADGATLQ